MRRNPVLIIAALLAALGPLAGNGLYAGPSGDSEEQLASLRSGLTGAGHLGLMLEAAGLIALCVVVACLLVVVAPLRPTAAATAGIAGAAMVAVKIGSAGPVMAAYLLADSIDAETASVLIGLNDAAFVLSGLLMSLAFGALGVGLWQADGPRWVTRTPAVLGVLGVGAGVAGITEPKAYVPVPFLLLILWMLALALWSATTRRAPKWDGRGHLASTMST
jgi:hypothetical protein